MLLENFTSGNFIYKCVCKRLLPVSFDNYVYITKLSYDYYVTLLLSKKCTSRDISCSWSLEYSCWPTFSRLVTRHGYHKTRLLLTNVVSWQDYYVQRLWHSSLYQLSGRNFVSRDMSITWNVTCHNYHARPELHIVPGATAAAKLSSGKQSLDC